MLTDIESALRKTIRSLGPDLYKKFLSDHIVEKWDSLVDKSVSVGIRPVVLEHGVLYVKTNSAAANDQLKFFTEEIIDNINDTMGDGEQIVKEIRPAKAHQLAAFKEKTPPPEEPKTLAETIDEIPLSPEEIARCEQSVQKISNAELRAVVLQTSLSQLKSNKFKISNGWHKCKTCDSLCAPDETFCEVCRLREYENIKRKLFDILYDAPWLSSEDVQKIFAEKFPNQSDRCPIDFVNSTRATLIQQLAGRLTLVDADESSNEILRLVMLERQLPPDKVTPAIIRRTLSELHFNFADPIRFQRYKFSKFRNLQSNA
ncbi:MAG: DUF721 domain-containing protein [Selenomonadaceae bacterium]|nr:DUF721 domain-containing protein [Selenomonadaceae bacterium]